MPDSSTPDSGGNTPDNSFLGRLKEAGLQADTVVRNAVDTATFGLADKIAAAGNATFDQSPGDWLDHYRSALNTEVARNLYDASHRRVAQLAGQALGVGLAAADGSVLGGRIGGASNSG